MQYLGTISKMPGDARGKESACQCRRWKRSEFDLWVGKIPGLGSGTPEQYSLASAHSMAIF